MTFDVNALLSEPILLGLGLAAFGVLWLFVAAVVSYILPAAPPVSRRPEAPSPSSPEPRPESGPSLPLIRRQFDHAYGQLKGRLEALEGAPALSLSHFDLFDNRIGQLKRDIDEIQTALHRVHTSDHLRAQLQGRVDALFQKLQGVAEGLVPPAAAVPARPIPAPATEEGWKDLKSQFEELRRMRGEFLSRRQALEEQARSETSAQTRSIEETRRALEGQAGEARALESRAAAFQEEKGKLEGFKQLFNQQQGGSPALPALEPLRQANEVLRQALREREELWEKERRRKEGRLERFHRRLDRWRQAWDEALRRDRQALDQELSSLREQSQSLKALLEQERNQAAQALETLKQEQEKLRLEQEHFQKNVAEPWQKERGEQQARLDEARGEAAALQEGLQALETRRAGEGLAFQESMAEMRRAVRERQSQWKEQVKALKADQDWKAAAAATELIQARERYRLEKLRLNETILAHRQALAQEMTDWEAEKARLDGRISEERAEWSRKLSEAAAQLAELKTSEEAARTALGAELAAQAGRRAEMGAWAEGRYKTLQEHLAALESSAAIRLDSLKAEKEQVQGLLVQERRTFTEIMGALDREDQDRKKSLDEARRKEGEAHAAFLAASQAEEERLRADVTRLQAAVVALEAKASAHQEEGLRRLARRRERYEGLLVKLEHRAEQEQGGAEAQLAQQRMSLQSLRQRVDQRRARLEKIGARRRQEAQTLFEEAREALEVVRQGYWRESKAWADRLAAARAQRAQLDEQRALWAAAPGRIADETKQNERRAADLYEQEKARLQRESEDHWKQFQETSAANEQALRRALAELQESEGGLSRQEAAMHDFLSLVKNQVANLQLLRDRFKAPAAEAEPSSKSSVA